MKGSYAYALFAEEPVGTFTDGHVFVNAPDLDGAERESGAGYWRCDIADDDRITWSENVYALFGLPTGTPVIRDWAVERYAESSRTVLERVRAFALNRKLGFILDAAICPEGGGSCWIRVMAVPILAKDSGRVVGLHGLKRPL
jgi:hypothetical protein